MRRLVIGIMLALFAVSAYSHGDDLYAFHKSKREKDREAETLMKNQKEEVRKLDKQFPKKDRYQIEEEYLNSFFQSLVGEWTTKEGQLVSINRNEIEIDGKKEITLSTYDFLVKSYGLILSNCLIKTYSPILGTKDEYCRIEIAVYDEEHIMVIVSARGDEKTYRLTRVY